MTISLTSLPSRNGKSLGTAQPFPTYKAGTARRRQTVTVRNFKPESYGWLRNCFGQLVHSRLAATEAVDGITRELYRPPLKRPDRGVPPPRSGLSPRGAP